MRYGIVTAYVKIGHFNSGWKNLCGSDAATYKVDALKEETISNSFRGRSLQEKRWHCESIHTLPTEAISYTDSKISRAHK